MGLKEDFENLDRLILEKADPAKQRSAAMRIQQQVEAMEQTATQSIRQISQLERMLADTEGKLQELEAASVKAAQAKSAVNDLDEAAQKILYLVASGNEPSKEKIVDSIGMKKAEGDYNFEM